MMRGRRKRRKRMKLSVNARKTTTLPQRRMMTAIYGAASVHLRR
jgi:hypothetical protein